MERRRRVLLALALVLAVAVAGALTVALVPSGPSLSPTWVSAPPAGAGGNHHQPAVGSVDGRTYVFAPISGTQVGPTCRLAALDADTGEVVWRHQVPPENCTVHAVADPSFTERNGRPALLITTTQNALFDLDPTSGDVRDRYDLDSYGYTPPMTVDLTPDDGEELLVVDARGTVQVIGADGRVVWREALGAYVWGTPAVGDLSGGGDPQVALGTSDGRLVVLDATGATVRQVDRPFESAITWLTSGQLDDDPARELVAATAGGQVVAVDGATGAVEWRRSFGSFAAVGAVGDGQGDGSTEVYAAAADGVVRALDGETGETEWERTVASSEVQMMPPPAFGDITGDGTEELVVASNDGRVAALDPASGRVLADYDRDGEIFVAPTLAAVDDDRGLEVVVIYVDGTVVRLDYEA